MKNNGVISDVALDLGLAFLDKTEPTCPKCKRPVFPEQEQQVLGEVLLHRICCQHIAMRVMEGNIPQFKFVDGVCIDIWFNEEEI